MAIARQLRILVFGDGQWAADSLIRLGRSAHRLVGAVVRLHPSDGTLLDAARALDLPVLQPVDVNAPASVEACAALTPDLCLSISYNQILRKPVLSLPPQGFVNFHAGKLPFYRGRNVINWAIINGETEIGLTAHSVDLGIDTGDIILQRVLPISWTDTYGEVLGRVVAAFPDLVADTVELFARGQATPCPQKPLPGTYLPGRGEGDEWLDWSDSSVNLHNKVRGITRPGPGARTMLGAETVTIWRAFCDPSWPSYIATPGMVVGRQAGGVHVKTGDSVLLVQEVEMGGTGARIPSWPLGTRLGMNPYRTIQALRDRVTVLEGEIMQLKRGGRDERS